MSLKRSLSLHILFFLISWPILLTGDYFLSRDKWVAMPSISSFLPQVDYSFSLFLIRFLGFLIIYLVKKLRTSYYWMELSSLVILPSIKIFLSSLNEDAFRRHLIKIGSHNSRTIYRGEWAYLEYFRGIERTPKVARFLFFLSLFVLNANGFEGSLCFLKRSLFFSQCFFDGSSLLTNSVICSDNEKLAQSLYSVQNLSLTHY